MNKLRSLEKETEGASARTWLNHNFTILRKTRKT